MVEKALSTLINAENHQSAYGALKHTDWTEEIGVPLLDKAFKPLVHSPRSKHEAISGHLNSDVGIRLQRKDSDLAYRVVAATGASGIHDSFVVEASREEELRRAMKRAFTEEYDGCDIGVSREFKPLTGSTDSASDTGRDFAPDRPASAEGGAERKPKASPTP